jgi:hypothetical protein
MLSSIRNGLRSGRNALLSNRHSNACNNNDVTAAVRAPKILRRGGSRATSNRVHWDRIVTVKPIEMLAADPLCPKCEVRGCGCIRWGRDTIGGFRVSIVSDHHETEPSRSEAGSFLRRIYERLSFDAEDRPANLPVPSQNLETASDNSTSNTAMQRPRRSKRSRRRIHRVQVAPVDATLQLEPNYAVQVNNPDKGSEQVRVSGKKTTRVFKELKCDLDGTYWTAPAGPRGRRAAA